MELREPIRHMQASHDRASAASLADSSGGWLIRPQS